MGTIRVSIAILFSAFVLHSQTPESGITASVLKRLNDSSATTNPNPLLRSRTKAPSAAAGFS
jgi:hypothetical protein